jgi:hypothetical protein
MLMYGGFHRETIETISEALNFVTKKISGFFDKKKDNVDISHHDVIDKECKAASKIGTRSSLLIAQ